MARLPAFGFGPGRYARKIPDGYEYAKKTSSTSFMSENLQKYYKILYGVKGTDLFSKNRIKECMKIIF